MVRCFWCKNELLLIWLYSACPCKIEVSVTRDLCRPNMPTYINEWLFMLGQACAPEPYFFQQLLTNSVHYIGFTHQVKGVVFEEEGFVRLAPTQGVGRPAILTEIKQWLGHPVDREFQEKLLRVLQLGDGQGFVCFKAVCQFNCPIVIVILLLQIWKYMRLGNECRKHTEQVWFNSVNMHRVLSTSIMNKVNLNT